MADTTDQPPGAVMAFLKNEQTQAVLRAALAPSGIAGVKLIEWGFPGAQLGGLAEFLIQVLPFVVVLAWSLAVKTHKSIIAKAATILADRQQGAIIINPAAAAPGVLKAVIDPALANVVPATPAAITAATSPTSGPTP